MQKITPCLWFNRNAEEAIEFYKTVFPSLKVKHTSYYGDNNEHGEAGSVLTIWFELEGQDFMALNGGPEFKFSEAVSFMINCKDQAEIDKYWSKLSAVPEAEICGWLKDKFGMSWQIVFEELPNMIGGDQAKADKVMAEVMKMKKLDIRALKKAYNES